MKKLHILIAALVLLTISFAAMAEVKISGEFHMYAVMGADAADVNDNGEDFYRTDLKINISGKLDDNNDLYIRLRYRGEYGEGSGGKTDSSSANNYVNKAYITTNLLGAFGIKDVPVTVSMIYGFWEWSNPDVGKVTTFQVEDIMDYKFEEPQVGFEINIMKMVDIGIIIVPTWNYAVAAAEKETVAYALYVAAEVAGIGVELDWSNSNTLGKSVGNLLSMDSDAGASNATNKGMLKTGSVGIGVGYTFDMITDLVIKVGANFSYDIDEDLEDLGIAQWHWGAGLSVAYTKLVQLDVAVWGLEDDPLAYLNVTLQSMPIDLLGIGINYLVGLYDGATDIDDYLITFHIMLNFGKSTQFYIGYAYVAQDNGFRGLGNANSSDDNWYFDAVGGGTSKVEDGGFYVRSKTKF